MSTRTGLALGLVAALATSATVFAFRAPPKPPVPEREGKPYDGKKVEKTDAEWRKLLTPEQYRVTRAHGTERACSGALWKEKGAGTYECVCCGQPLFESGAKYNSGTGWPSFKEALDDDRLTTRTDRSLGRVRTEVLCSRCDAHLGHVFGDGPKPTGLRFCINSVALKFVPSFPDPSK